MVILLIDDNKIDLFIHTEVIKRVPFITSVIQFTHAAEALNYLEENDASRWPDVILLDIHMPVMNGFDFLSRYEQLPAASRRKARLIMVSSSLDSNDHRRAKANPEVFAFIEKPLSPDRLEELILEKK